MATLRQQKIAMDEEIKRLSSPGRVTFHDHQPACKVCHMESVLIARLSNGEYQFYCKKCFDRLCVASPYGQAISYLCQ